MDISGLVDRQIVKAFYLAQSMLIPVVMHLRSDEGFNFNTGLVTVGNLDDVVTRGLVVKTERKAATTRKQVLLERNESRLDQYDRITLENKVWHIDSVIFEADKIAMVEVYNG